MRLGRAEGTAGWSVSLQCVSSHGLSELFPLCASKDALGGKKAAHLSHLSCFHPGEQSWGPGTCSELYLHPLSTACDQGTWEHRPPDSQSSGLGSGRGEVWSRGDGFPPSLHHGTQVENETECSSLRCWATVIKSEVLFLFSCGFCPACTWMGLQLPTLL